MDEATRKSVQDLLGSIRTGGSLPGQVQQAFAARAQLDVLLAEELSTQIYHLAGVMEKAPPQVTVALDRVVTSMDKSTETMARLTKWLIAAALISAVGTLIQMALVFLKKG